MKRSDYIRRNGGRGARAERLRGLTALLLALILLSGAPAGRGEALDEEAFDIVGDVAEVPGIEEQTEELQLPEEWLEAITPEPTFAPTPTPDATPWLSSVNYPKEKVSFEAEIWAILTGRWGLSAEQAAGLMSSIEAESGFSPYNVQGRGGSDDRGHYAYDAGDSVGFGLCQWTSSGRKAALRRYAEAHGSADLVWDFDIQMGYMAGEIDMGALKSASSLYEAAEWAVLSYERPDQSYANSWPGTRYERALRIYSDHTGKAYEEPKLKLSVTFNGESVKQGDACALRADGTDGMTVRCNYYWRLEQTEQSEPGWLEVKCASLYHPERTEDCVCGYVCDGRKELTLNVVKLPPVGQTWRTTLCLEIWRGAHVTAQIPVTVTRTPQDALRSFARSIDPAFLGTALALTAALMPGGRLSPANF